MDRLFYRKIYKTTYLLAQKLEFCYRLKIKYRDFKNLKNDEEPSYKFLEKVKRKQEICVKYDYSKTKSRSRKCKIERKVRENTETNGIYNRKDLVLGNV